MHQAACANHPEQLAAGICGRCGDFVCARCALPVEAEVRCPRCATLGAEVPHAAIPWEQREELGWARAWLETARASIVPPAALWGDPGFYGRLRARGRYGPAVGYGALNLSLWFSLAVLRSLLLSVVDLLGAEGVGLDSGPGAVLVGGAAAVGVWVALVAPGVFVAAALLHVGAMAISADAGGFRGTLRALCYSSGVLALGSMLGLIVGLVGLVGIWAPEVTAVVEGITILVDLGAMLAHTLFLTVALRSAHGTSWWRAALVGGGAWGALALSGCCAGALLGYLVARAA